MFLELLNLLMKIIYIYILSFLQLFYQMKDVNFHEKFWLQFCC